MPKPPGIGFGITEGGDLRLSVTKSSRAEDLIYDAVQEAQSEGMTPTRFVSIARSAWSTTREEQTKHEDDEFKNLKV